MKNKDLPKTAQELKLMQGFPPPADRRVTLANWSEGVGVRWGFMHARELVPSAEVYRGSNPPVPLKQNLIDLDAISYDTYSGGKMTIGEMLSLSYTDGFLVMHHGKIITEKYFNGMQPDTKHLMQSVSKSLTGALACILVEEGMVNPDKLVTDYIPELGLSGYADATVRQVMDMTASIVYNEHYGVVSEVTMHEATAGWRPRTGQMTNLPESQFIFLQSLQKDPQFKHGERFSYISSNTDVLGWLLERATDEKLTVLLSKKIWSKLGAEENAYMLVDPWGSSAASGGLNLTLRDTGRFGQMMLQGGTFDGNKIMDQKWTEDIRFKGDKDAWKKNEGSGIGYLLPEGSYRNQWWVTGKDNEAFYAAGIHGQYIYIVPEADLVIVKMSSQPTALNSAFIENALYGFEAIAQELSSQKSGSFMEKITDFRSGKAK